MNEKEVIKIELEKILGFADACDRIFIYGAGNIAKAVLDVLENEKRFPDGIIVSKPQDGNLRGYPIYSVEDTSRWIKENDGVILGFTGAKEEDIQSKFTKDIPRILEINHLAVLALDDDIRFRPIVSEAIDYCVPCSAIGEIKYSMNFLIIRLDMIGDFIFITPFIRELRRNFPRSRITLVIRKQNYMLAKECPYIDRLLLYESPFIEGELSRQCEKYREAKDRAKRFSEKFFIGEVYDCVFYTRELLLGRNVLDEFYLGLYSKARIRIGRQLLLRGVYEEHLYGLVNNLYSFVSRHSEAMHEVEYALKMLQDVGLDVQDDRMELWIDGQAKYFADFLLHKYRTSVHTIVALGLVASVPSRTWKSDNYVRLIEQLLMESPNGYAFILLGGEDAVGSAEYIYNHIGEQSTRLVENLAGKIDLMQTASVISGCDLYVGSNTGLLHMASAFKKPSVTIYGELDDGKPTDGDSPFRMGAWRVTHIDLVPSAGLDGCRGVCRMHFSHCINQIKPCDVANAIKKLI